MKKCLPLLVLVLCSLTLHAQWDVVVSTEAIGSLHRNTYYRYQGTDNYLKADQYFGTFDAATIEPRYQLQYSGKTALGLGLPFGFSSYSSDDFEFESAFSYHAHLMFNLSGGIYAQRWSEEIYNLKRFGYFVGVGPGFYGCNATPSITETKYDDIPVGTEVKEISATQGGNYIYQQTPSMRSFGLQIQAGVCFNYYGYKLLPLFYLPTGLRVSFHKALDAGGDFFTIGVTLNQRVWWSSFRHYRSRYRGF